MALFKRTKKEEVAPKKEAKEETTKEVAKKTVTKEFVKDLSSVITKPRITEKAALTVDGSNAYTFNVDRRANKTDIKAAIEKIYKVVPVKVNIISIPRKTVRSRGKLGTKGGGKKAIVFLKKNDRIEFV